MGAILQIIMLIEGAKILFFVCFAHFFEFSDFFCNLWCINNAFRRNLWDFFKVCGGGSGFFKLFLNNYM